eukprot:TRINITY_DN528_c0_g1_i9.p1 TRINITY_DN528_c0_g1~~TRINITY_DN528_c0_g1_i9.p1  ORF type:complete len:362 (+),score=66.23 TRINITY_DN528_c0_g1_i9:222-1307(+)
MFLTTYTRIWRAAKQAHIKIKNHVSRLRVVHEIVSVERSYTKSLSLVIDKFMTPLREKALLPEASIKTVFCNIPEIYKIHQTLLQTFEERLDAWSYQQSFADLFKPDLLLQMRDLYSKYINNYDSAMECIKTFKGQENLAKFIRGVEDYECNGTDLVSFLVMPVQRFPRYTLLIKELNKATDKSHPDKTNITNVLAQLERVTQFLNESRRKHSSQAKLEQMVDGTDGIQKYLSVDELMDGTKLEDRLGDFIMEGPLILLSSPLRDGSVSIYVFLFDGIIFFAKHIHNSTIQSIRGVLGLKKFKFSLLDAIDFRDIVYLTRLEETKFGITLKKDKVFKFETSSSSNREQWVRAIETSLGGFS